MLPSYKSVFAAVDGACFVVVVMKYLIFSNTTKQVWTNKKMQNYVENTCQQKNQ